MEQVSFNGIFCNGLFSVLQAWVGYTCIKIKTSNNFLKTNDEVSGQRTSRDWMIDLASNTNPRWTSLYIYIYIFYVYKDIQVNDDVYVLYIYYYYYYNGLILSLSYYYIQRLYVYSVYTSSYNILWYKNC